MGSPPDNHSAIVEIVGGAVHRTLVAESDDDILDALGGPPALVVVDAPLAIPNATGKRDVEAVLAWCDIPAFPVSRRRMDALFGGARGVVLARTLLARGHDVVETIPDLVLRQLTWERDRPADAALLDLRSYREAWLDVRAPAFRPGRRGLPRGAKPQAARALLADAVDLALLPHGGHTESAALLDAAACAYAAWRHLTTSASVDLGTPERGRMIFPADTNLAARVALTTDRLRQEGAILIPTPAPLGR